MNLKEIEDLARAAHEGQKRRFSDKPYISHPLAVKRVLEAAGVVDENVLAAALLHDTIEDTILELDDLRDEAGDSVSDLVNELTFTGCDKREWLESFAEKSPEAIVIKLCDRICNILDFLEAAGQFEVNAEKPLDYYIKSQPITTAFLNKRHEIETVFGGGTVKLLSDFYMCMVRIIEDYRTTLSSIEKLVEVGLSDFDNLLADSGDSLFEMNEKPLWRVE